MNALLTPESCPFCGAGIMLRGSGATFLCESWKHRNGEMDQSRECLNRQRDQLLDRIKRLEEDIKTTNANYQYALNCGGLALGYAAKGDFESAYEVWSKAK